MKRKEQINSFAADKLLGLGPAFSESEIQYNNGYMRGLTEGAEWADGNPDERMIAKYLYEKKGYPIDLNGHLPSFEETMKDVEKYNKYKEDKLIEKARELLARMVWEVTYEDLEGNSVQHYDKMEFIEDFCKAMKGE